jgi:hypothetical protein
MIVVLGEVIMVQSKPKKTSVHHKNSKVHPILQRYSSEITTFVTYLYIA